MKRYSALVILIVSGLFGVAQEKSVPDYKWGNVAYFNLSIGESIYVDSTEIKLLELENHYNKIQVANDTFWLKVSRRSLPHASGSLRLFAADNKNVKNTTNDRGVHSLLSKDVLLGVSLGTEKMLDQRRYIFPISFSDGFLWKAEEDSYMFSFQEKSVGESASYCRSYEGIGIDLNDARGIEKHWIVAIENSTVVWIEDKKLDEMDKEACVLLQSNEEPNIYYVYNHLYNNSIEVKKGQKLVRGELIGTAWGNSGWGHLQLLVVNSDSVPSYENRFHNSLNFFPQLYELYFQQSYQSSKSFTRGKINFGRPDYVNGNEKNTSAYEGYLGKGWVLGRWNKVDKVERAERGEEGNARLRKVLFSNLAAQSVAPNNYFDYEVNVKNGVYRIRAKVGDLYLPSWQKIYFEGVAAATFSLEAAEQKWTTERVVKVKDHKLTIRIYIGNETQRVAGLSEIVFQRAY